MFNIYRYFAVVIVAVCTIASSAHAGLKIMLDGAPVGLKIFDSEKTLIAKFGLNNVCQDSVHIGEGEYEKCTTIYKNDSTKCLSIIWNDKELRTNFYDIRWGHEATKWAINNVITMGTSLLEIEKINGRPFILAGFGWDYGGTIYSYNGGNLDKSFMNPYRICLRLEPTTYKDITAEEESEVTGDREISSTNPIMRRLKLKVYDIIIFKGQ
jgi:hypothetical protein